jgi:hypothetical protein
MAKERIYTVGMKKKNHEDENSTKFPKTLESHLEHLTYQYQQIWNTFRNKAEANIDQLKLYEKDFEMKVVFETHPKLDSIA